MNPNNKFDRCATKFLTIIIVLSIMGCGVGVPTKASVNIVRSQDLKIDDDDIISMAPRRLLEEITKEIEKTYTNIELVDGLNFRDTAFPEGRWRLKKLLEPQVRRQVNEQLNVDYLALVGSIEESQGEGKGFMIPPVLTVGSGEVVSTITALIIDLKSGKLVSNIVCDARGTMYLFHYVIFVTGSEPQTDSGAAEGLAIEIGKVITELTQPGKVRLAVLAVEDFEISYDINDWRSANLSHNKLALEILEERAREGEQDAQWLLYQVQPNAENMTWLCRDADQGMARACSELGKLYYYGSDEYRKSMGIHVPADISRSCMWFHLAGLAKITEQTEMNDVDSKSALYESAEVERTANAMTAQELAEAEQLLINWEPGQCERDLLQHMVTEYVNDPVLERLCTAADLGDFKSREELGRIYFFGSRGVTEDIARAYMWYRLASKVYEPPSGPTMQTICDAMTPEQSSIAIKLLKEWKVGQCEKELLQ